MTVAIVFFIGLFIVGPAVLFRFAQHRVHSSIAVNALEGVFRVALFLAYLALIGRMKDIRRVFQYHGAEHKTIAAYEHDAPLEPEAVDRFSTLHVRCGTNFLLIVMILTIFVFAVFGNPPLVWRVVSRVVAIPIIAGLAFELLRLGAKFHRSLVMRALMAPGLWLQKITTKPPDADQIEVAITSFQEVLRREAEAAVPARAKIWVRTRAFDGFVTLGDNVYGSGDPDDFRAAWTKPYGWVDRRGVPVVWTLGNHDIETRDGRPEIKFFHMPGRWYAQTIGPVEFVVLDANQPDSREQRKWLRSTLAASDAPWTVVVFHQPAYSCGSHGSTPEVQSQWVPLFRRFHVSVVVNGHDHDYQRFPPQRGVTYVVEGAGGAGLYEVGECPEGTPDPAVADDTHHGFLYLSATTRKLTGRAVSDDGTVLDTFVLRN